MEVEMMCFQPCVFSVEITSKGFEACRHLLWRREWLQSGYRALGRGSLQCQIHPREEAYRWFLILHHWNDFSLFLELLRSTQALHVMEMFSFSYRAILWWDQPGHGEILFWSGWHTQGPGDGSGGDPHSLWELGHHALRFTCAWGRKQRSREW